MDFKAGKEQAESEIRRIQSHFSFKDSMLAKFSTSKQKYIAEALTIWLYIANGDFDIMREDILGLRFARSIDALELAKMELRELNSFFETGKCNSLLIQYNEVFFAHDFKEKELYESYLLLLRGDYEFFITEAAYSRHEQEVVRPSPQIIEVGKTSLINESLMYQTPYRYIKNNPRLLEQWAVAARIQALLWIKEYLERIIKTKSFTHTSLSIDDLVEKPAKGFDVPNSDKVIPALYKALVDKELIEETAEEKFKDAFLNGNGFIKWLGGSKKQVGTKSLIYLIAMLKNAKIIQDDDFIKITASMFKDKNGKLYSHGSLTQSSSKTDVEPPKKARDIDIIVDKLKNL